LKCEGTKIWGDEILIKRFRNIDAGIGIRRTVGCKNKEHWHKICVYMIKYDEKWEKVVRKYEREVEINSED
jgi:hypothetical protein